MGKPDRTGRSKGTDARHVRVYAHIEATRAWRELSGVAVKAWVTIGLMHNGSNNGALIVSARQLASRIGTSHQTAARAIRELENKGFLRMTRAGAFAKRQAAEYRLTHLRDDVKGDPPTNDFKRPAFVATVTPLKA